MVTVTERWEVEETAACIRCGGETTVAPVPHGVELAGGILCDPCFYGVFHGSKAAALSALGPAGEGGDGDGDGPEPGPAAPALNPPVLDLAAAAAQAARPFTHLSELPPTEQEEYLRWAADVSAQTPDPEPCVRCGRPVPGPLCRRCGVLAAGSASRYHAGGCHHGHHAHALLSLP